MSAAPGIAWTLTVCARGMIGPDTPTDVRHALADVGNGGAPSPAARLPLLSHPCRACRLLALRVLGVTAAERAQLAAAGVPVPDNVDELGAADSAADVPALPA